MTMMREGFLAAVFTFGMINTGYTKEDIANCGVSSFDILIY